MAEPGEVGSSTGKFVQGRFFLADEWRQRKAVLEVTWEQCIIAGIKALEEEYRLLKGDIE